MKVAYVVADLRRVGPSNQTLNIIKNSRFRKDSVVVTLFAEPSDSMKSEFERAGIEVKCLNLGRVSFVVSGSKKLRKFLSEWGADIAHSYGVKPDHLCQKVCTRAKIKHVITLRNYPKEDIPTRMKFPKSMIALHSHLKTLKKAKYVVTCSYAIEKRMKKDYPNMNIMTIQNGVDVEKYKPVDIGQKKILRKELDLPIDEKIFISVSSFIKRKRIRESIEGFLKYNKKKNSRFLLLGDGPEFSNIEEEYGSRNGIYFLGKLSNVQDYLHASDVFVSSSESEGLPNGVIEAIACGLPVVLSDIDQHLEVLREVPNSGIVYNLGNVDDLSNRMDEILTYDNSKSNIVKSSLTMKAMSEKYVLYYIKVENEE